MTHQQLPHPDRLTTEVVIIGAGATGAGIMRDLALRGISSILLDKEDLCAGASGGNHGLLHSGARYVYKDQHSAIECRQENEILRRTAPHCIEETGGLFVAVEGDDLEYAQEFPIMCEKAGIECQELSVSKARELEPALSEKVAMVYSVPDATIDPFRLVLENVGHAKSLGKGKYLSHSELRSFTLKNGMIKTLHCYNSRCQKEFSITAKQVINAGGAWAMDIARKAGCDNINLLYSKGTLLVTNERLCQRVINRLRPPGNGDILVPGGTVSILGTTSVATKELENTAPTVSEVDENIIEGGNMLPSLISARYIRAFARIRPLVLSQGASDARDVARSFSIFDHQEQGVSNFTSITGGKLTTFRLMAEKCVDLVAKKIGNNTPCCTETEPLPQSRGCGWTEPGAAPRHWHRKGNEKDYILCECEMVPQSAIDNIVEHAPGGKEEMNLEAIALRSRAGKGPCQGSFCGIRIASHLYDTDFYHDSQGAYEMRNFFNERFKGVRTIIWGEQMAQMELAEALHSGLLGLDSLPVHDKE